MSTLTNCVRGALGFLDVVSKILGSFSVAFAYSSSICDLGTKSQTNKHNEKQEKRKEKSHESAEENLMEIPECFTSLSLPIIH